MIKEHYNKECTFHTSINSFPKIMNDICLCYINEQSCIFKHVKVIGARTWQCTTLWSPFMGCKGQFSNTGRQALRRRIKYKAWIPWGSYRNYGASFCRWESEPLRRGDWDTEDNSCLHVAEETTPQLNVLMQNQYWVPAWFLPGPSAILYHLTNIFSLSGFHFLLL